MPTANSGARRPLSVAAPASLRMGDAIGDETMSKPGKLAADFVPLSGIERSRDMRGSTPSCHPASVSR